MPWLPVLHSAEEDRVHFAGRIEAGQELLVFAAPDVAGFAVLTGDELDGLYVAPEAQRQGVGSALFRHVQGLRPEGFGFWVFSENRRARRFYESHGAWCMYETDGADNEERVPDARYEWGPSRGRAEA